MEPNNNEPKTTPAPAKPRPISFCVLSKEAGPNGCPVVQSVDKLSAAAKAGIAAGDEILALNGVKITSAAQAMELLQGAGIGATVTVRVARQGAQADLSMVVQAKTLSLDVDDLDEVVERKIAPAA